MKPHGLYISPTEFVAFAQNGNKQSLSAHIATRERGPDFTALGLYLPNPDPILKKQGRDIAIYSDLRADAHVGGCIRRRKAGVLTMEWRLKRGSASARSTKLCQDAISRLDMHRLLREILEAPLFGWQPLEVLWSSGESGGPVIPQDVLAKPVHWFHFDAEAQLRFRSRQSPLYGESVAARKFLIPAQDASYANPYGFADLSMCFWPTVFKRGGLKFWVTFSEKYGTPWLVGKTPRGTAPKEQEALLDQLEAMVQDAVAVIPDDASVDIVEAAGKTASADLYERLLMFCRSEIAIALLGQNQTTEASANRASATAGLQVTDELRDADALLAQAAINQLLRWIVDLNEGEAAPAPVFELYEQQKVDTAQAERDEKLSRSGARFTPQYYKRIYELQDGDLDESAPLAPVAPPLAFASHSPLQPPQPAAHAGTSAYAERPAEPGTDAIDALIDSAMSDWQPLLNPLIAPLQAAMDAAAANGDSAGQLLQRLPELLSQIDTGALQEALTRASFAARLGGVAGLGIDGAPLQPDAAAARFAEEPIAPAAPVAPVAPTPSVIVNVHPVIELPAQAAPVIHNHVQLPQSPAPVVHNTIELPPQPAPQVSVINQVQPAGITVIDQHPSRAVQTVVRDSADEIVQTVTVYEK
ncbi:DUF935 domain-containing protein [Serpentinimonas maccroryi]|uniref:DUF935 domain-containing protein n=1 Tax=Serpentinimonas maccroryi TaxID=1458426 RepID=UPI0020345342|nr:DUF935 family protein [Serpentinimonas maccroryi]MCM2480173.1 DUF935 family protein [Serpentinimonas maccroryi]